MRKLNKYTCWGLLLNGIWLLSTRFNLLPNFIEGIDLGLGLVFIVIGMISVRYEFVKIRKYKKCLFKKI